MDQKPFLKLSNGKILNIGDIENTQSGEITLQKFSYGLDIASRTSIINHLIHKYKLKNYLEIGVRDGRNFDRININKKTAVDPFPTKEMDNLKKCTSDEFFRLNKEKFDIIFIDGLHLESQVDKDITGALNFLSDNGFIVMHDCNPPSKFHQRENYEVNGKFPVWNGTVWKSFAKLRINNHNLKLSCVNCDWGVGLIQKSESAVFKYSKDLTYNFLEINRAEILNLISVSYFIENY